MIRVSSVLLCLFVTQLPQASQAQWTKLVREGVEAVTKKSGRVVRKGIGEGAETSARRAARPIVRKSLNLGVKKTSKAPVAKLLTRQADEAMEVAGKTATTKGGAAGDVADWLWKRKGSVAVGTAATAVLLQPTEAIRAGENVATTALEATATHVAAPLAKELARPAAVLIERVSYWILAIVICVAWFRWKRKRGDCPL